MVEGDPPPSRGGKIGGATERGRSSREQGLITGAFIDTRWSLANEEWLLIGNSYCPAFRLAMLAKIVVDAEAHYTASCNHGELSDQRVAKRAAARAKMAFGDQQTRMRKAERAQTKQGGVANASVIDGDMLLVAGKGKDWQDQITTLVLDYFSWKKLEQEAPPVNETIDWLSRLERGARAFTAAYDRPLDGRAQSLARSDLERNMTIRDLGARPVFDSLRAPVKMGLRELVTHMRDTQRAAATAIAEMGDEDTLVNGWAWNRWIIALTNFCERNNLPVGAGKGFRISNAPSEFVGFVIAIQSEFPEPFRLHNGTVDAATKAISEARRFAKRRANTSLRAEEEEFAARQRADADRTNAIRLRAVERRSRRAIKNRRPSHCTTF